MDTAPPPQAQPILMSVLSQQVVKEPKGFIRILQVFLAIFALYTTAGFSTQTSFDIKCHNRATSTIKYDVEYPFDFQNQEIYANRSCEEESGLISYKLPMDFSSSPQFYVTVGVLSVVYAIGAFYMYSACVQRYRENALIPVIDLIATSIITLFWVAGTLAWSAGVSDIKYYVDPMILKDHLAICKEGGEKVCTTVSVGKWSGLNISVIFGFGCIMLWGASVWFVYKETQFFKQMQQQRDLMQQQFGGVAPTNTVIPDQAPPGSNPFGNYDPIGQTTAAPNPYIQQPQYGNY